MTDETTQFGAILTEIGEDKLAASMLPQGAPLEFAQMGIDNGGLDNEFIPDRLMTALANEEYRAAINGLVPDPLDATKVIATLIVPAIIPDKPAGFWARGVGIYDTAGDLVAVANIPPSFKPGSNQKAIRPMKVSVRLAVGSAANVQLIVSQAEVYSTHEHVDNAIEVLKGELVDRAGDSGMSVKYWKSLVVGNDWTAAVQAALDSDFCHIQLDIPTGGYVTNMTISKPKKLTGSGFNRDQVIWQQADAAARGNMFTITANLSFLEVEGLGFVGNRAFQTTTSVTGQDMCAFSARAGSCRNFIFRNCAFTNFGDNAGIGGAAMLLGALSGTNRLIENITFEKCVFRDISNVPGVYVNGSSLYHNTCRNIKFLNNVVIQSSAAARQNIFYVLGLGLNNPGYGCEISGNYVELSQSIDVFAEINFMSGFNIENNTVVYRNAASGTAVLLRETVENGTVADNAIINLGTGNLVADSAAISLVNFSTGKQRNISILDNTVVGFQKPIVVSSGSEDIDVYRNKLFGKSSTDKIISAVEIANANSVRVKDNVTKYALYALELYAGDDILYEGNTLTLVGDGASGAIAASVGNAAVTNLRIKENTVLSFNPGTPYFVNMQLASSVGNRIDNNLLPANLPVYNPGYASSYAAVVTPAETGALIAGRVYAFDQGQLDMADGQGFTIGANLDAQAPACVLGDQIIGVSANVSTKGCSINAWIEATGQIRIRVQNETGASRSIAAARWRVTLLKASLMAA